MVAQRGGGGFSLRLSQEKGVTQMMRSLLGEACRVGRISASPLRVTVMIAFLVVLPLAACGSSNQNHTHSGECPGRATFPEAKPGYLCVYEENRENIVDGDPNFYVLDSFGFGIWAGAANAGHFRSYGTWAVTAPNAA
jgi:hypothetical protein